MSRPKSNKSICPSCNGPKKYTAKTCFKCRFPAIINCPVCGLEAPRTELKDGKCPPCFNKVRREFYENNPDKKERKALVNELWRENNPEKIKRTINKSKCKTLGLQHMTEHILLLMDSQKECLICKTHVDICGTLHIDHDHITGEFRGLICLTCNAGIGMLKDSPEILAAAIEYLKKPRS